MAFVKSPFFRLRSTEIMAREEYMSPEKLCVEGPDGRRFIDTRKDLEKLIEDFNEELNTVLSQRVDLEEKLAKANGRVAELERKVEESYQRGYEAAMLENSSWDVD
jgi:predicted nuclease with TOPRIM domain